MLPVTMDKRIYQVSTKLRDDTGKEGKGRSRPLRAKIGHANPKASPKTDGSSTSSSPVENSTKRSPVENSTPKSPIENSTTELPKERATGLKGRCEESPDEPFRHLMDGRELPGEELVGLEAKTMHQVLTESAIKDVEPEAELPNEFDRRAASKLLKEAVFKPGEPVVCPPLWTNEQRPLPNYHQGLREWQRQHKKLLKNPQAYAEYDESIQGWLKAGFCIEAKDPKWKDVVHTIDHFPVIRPEATTTRLRVVFNARRQYKGISLNDCLSVGPAVINPITDVLHRFRRYPYALSSDASKMFLRFRLPEEDWKYHAFVYQGPNDPEPKLYLNIVHIFGSRSSLTVAVMLVKLVAVAMEDEYPEAADVVLRGSMVDDNFFSCTNEKELVRAKEGLTKIFERCGVPLHKWTSNSTIIAEPSEKEFQEIDPTDGDSRTLGLIWNTHSDELRFKSLTIDLPEEKFTRLSVLQHYMRLYDPVGLVGPVAVRARRHYSKTCQLTNGWVDPVPEELRPKWATWFKELKMLDQVKLQRCMFLSDQAWLAIFSDAADGAVGAVAYMVNPETNTSRLVFSKAKINAVVSNTIRALELAGTVKATSVETCT
jgi:hypothetical protein